jgi:hypothetical protein
MPSCMNFRKSSRAGGWIPCPIRANIADKSFVDMPSLYAARKQT